MLEALTTESVATAAIVAFFMLLAATVPRVVEEWTRSRLEVGRVRENRKSEWHQERLVETRRLVTEYLRLDSAVEDMEGDQLQTAMAELETLQIAITLVAPEPLSGYLRREGARARDLQAMIRLDLEAMIRLARQSLWGDES